ncbi:MAG: cofactor assembly of complex C subunit B [Cyanobacteria bacterium J06626_18]
MTFDFALPSAFGLTFLLFIGLGFFIRASTKDRIETATYITDLDDVALLEKVQNHFTTRAYRVAQVEPDLGRMSLQGMVKASVFLAVFLGLLAGIGFFCLALVLTIAFPNWGYAPYGLLLATPIAPWFYWKGATRPETVTIQLDAGENELSTLDALSEDEASSKLLVSAHRDELFALEAQTALKRIEAE